MLDQLTPLYHKYNVGRKHTEEWKKANSERMKGENHPLFGRKLSEERKKEMSKIRLGEKASEETKKKMSESGKEAWKLRKLTLINLN